MKINKFITASAILAMNLASVQIASAANTITFKGSITDATCDVGLKYGGAAVGTAGTGTITLDQVSKSALTAANSTAGQVPFIIIAKNCSLGTPAKTKVSTNFKSSNGDSLGYLDNTAATNAATKVQFRLLDSDRSVIKVNSPTQSTTMPFVTINTTEGADTEMVYFVEYISVAGGATAGDITSDVNYELMYK